MKVWLFWVSRVWFWAVVCISLPSPSFALMGLILSWLAMMAASVLSLAASPARSAKVSFLPPRIWSSSWPRVWMLSCLSSSWVSITVSTLLVPPWMPLWVVMLVSSTSVLMPVASERACRASWLRVRLWYHLFGKHQARHQFQDNPEWLLPF